MRLSDIRGERVFDVLADIVEPAYNIAIDDDAMTLFRRETIPEGVDVRQYVLERASKALPYLIRRHKDDLCSIFATLEGVGIEEYKDGLTMPKLIGSVAEMLTDEDLLAFLS